jgi:hypothetical protein
VLSAISEITQLLCPRPLRCAPVESPSFRQGFPHLITSRLRAGNDNQDFANPISLRMPPISLLSRAMNSAKPAASAQIGSKPRLIMKS